MPRPHSLRDDSHLPAIEAALREGRSVREIAAGFSKSKSAVDRYAQTFRQAEADAARLPELLSGAAPAANGTPGGNGTPPPVGVRRVSGLRIYGGKARLAPRIARLLPAHTTYVEPFGGMASVLLAKERAPLEVWNDADGQLVAFFRVLRERPAELCAAVRLTPFSRREAALACGPAEGLPELEVARRVVVLHGQSHHGAVATCQMGWRFERRATRTRSNAEEWTALPERLAALARRWAGVQLEHDDALRVIARYDGPGACLYVDPPYPRAVRGKRWRDAGYRHELADADHVRLAGLLQGIAGVAVVSGYDCPLYEALYTRRGWRLVRLQATDQAGGPRTECLWLHPRCAERAPHALALPGLEAAAG